MLINLIVPTLIISSIALLLSICSCIAFVAQRMSTHKIEWRPLVQEKAEEEAKEVQKEIEEEEDKILESAIQMQRSKKKKDQDPLDSILETSNY